METVEYAAGRLTDVFGELSQPTVLLWHGQQPDARASVRPLAELIAAHGLGVIAPDWNSYADDGGRADLLRLGALRPRAGRSSRRSDTRRLVHGRPRRGGADRAGAAVGVAFAHTVCLAGAFMVPDPIFNELPATQVNDGAPRSPFTLLHGVADRVIAISAGHDFAAALRRHQWPVQVVELPADHGSIAGAVYDASAGRYRAAIDAETLAVAADVAARIAAAGQPLL